MDHIITGQNQTLIKFYAVQLFMASQELTNSARTGSDNPEVPSCPMPMGIAETLSPGVINTEIWASRPGAGLRADNLSP
jgi:hypothetical protein